MPRKTITVQEAAHEEASEYKREGDTWSEIIVAGAKTLAQDGEGQGERQDTPEDVLTEDHIDDIGAEVERRLERLFENSGRAR